MRGRSQGNPEIPDSGEVAGRSVGGPSGLPNLLVFQTTKVNRVGQGRT